MIHRLEREDAFAAVEVLRKECRARRGGEEDAPSLAELLARVDAIPLELVPTVARGFPTFLLINTAEQVHRVRRRHAYKRLPTR